MKRMLLLLVFTYSSVTARADFRVWTDAEGHSIEAEFSGVNDDKVILRTTDGKEFKISPTTLCMDDQKFLAGKIPDSLFVAPKDVKNTLRLDADLKKKAESRGHYYNDVVCTATIFKKSGDPYEGKLKATFYIIGESRHYNMSILLDRVEHEFDFISEREVSFSGEMFTLYDSNNVGYGADYKGYLITVQDADGNEILIKSSHKDFEENRAKLKEFKRGQYFRKNYSKGDQHSGNSYYY